MRRRMMSPMTSGDVVAGLSRSTAAEMVWVVIATGSQPKKLNIPGEKEFYGRGLSYCATCDGPFFKDKNVVIIGAGNSGLQEGLQVLEYAKQVTFLEFLPYSRAERILQDRVNNHPKSALLFNQQVTAVQGDKTVTGVVAVDRETKEALRAEGIAVVTGIHALGDGVGSAFTAKHGGRAADEIVRDTRYRFCQGMKVAVECAVMAAEAGELDVNEEAIAIAGSSTGADTAIVIKPAHAHSFLDLEIREILAKPRSG